VIKNPFDLSSDYMLRVQLVEKAPDDYIVIAVLHHIAADGWSMRILLREFTEIYKALVTGMQPFLSPLGIQYADYAVWQKSEAQTRLLEQKLY
jgi:tyrocidine synthetase III